jgi:hypothetical protein
MFTGRRRCKRKSLAFLTALFLTCSSIGPALTWAQATRVYGPEDRDVPLPAERVTASVSDQTAQALLQAYLQAAGAPQWQGIQATGTITYAGNEAPPQGSATLTITREGYTRLDVTNSSGDTSVRICGPTGGFQDINGNVHRLPLRNARVGLFAYPYLLSPRLANQRGLAFQSGPSQLGGSAFDKLSLSRPMIERPAPAPNRNGFVTTDLYLSPETRLIYKSVDLVEALDPSPQRYVRVVTYEDYRSIGGVQIPFRYTETINGVRSWVLQLTTAQPEAQSDPSYFTF